jgi:hypothetical protein
MAFNYNYKPMNYQTAQKQVAGQVDPMFNRAVQGVQQQKYQNDVQAGQVSASRGLAHSGLAADQLNKIAIASQSQIGDLNAQRATQTSQMANDLMWRDKEFAMQDRSQKFNEFNTDRGYNYQAGRDKVADTRYNSEISYQKNKDTRDEAWRKHTFNNMSASEKTQLAWAKSQYGEDAAWKMYELNYNGELQKSQSQAEINAYTP